MSIKTFFTEEQKENIKQAIVEAELNTSGEIRVHLESTCDIDPKEKAIQIFEKLKMHQTELRNGVLIYLAVKSKKFAIVGDKGIDERVPDGFWEETKNAMTAQFKNGNIDQGLIDGIGRAGKSLKTYFPYQSDDVNELSDDISFGEDKKGEEL